MQGRAQTRERLLKGRLDGYEPQAENSRRRIRLDRQPVEGGLKPHALQSAATGEYIGSRRGRNDEQTESWRQPNWQPGRAPPEN